MPKSKSTRKPSMKQAKAMITKSHKKKAQKNMDTFFLKTKSLGVITPSQGALVANYIYNSFTLDPTGSAAAYITNSEFNLYRLQYDKFRVNSVKVTVTPKANVLDQAVANNDGLNVTGDGVVHTCIDRDGLAPSNKAVIARYPSYKKYSTMKKFSRTYSVKYPMGVWIDCATPGSFNLSQELGLKGGVTLYAENFLEDLAEIFNEGWAEVLVEHCIVFQGKTSNSLTGVYDNQDPPNLIGVTINKIEEPNMGLQTPLRNIRGTLRDTLVVTDDPNDDVIISNVATP